MGLLDKEYSKPVSTSASPRGSQMKSVNRVQNLMDTKGYSMDRANRRLLQEDLYEQFKKENMKPVLTSEGKPTGAYQSITPGGPTLSDKANELAMKYGPTRGEIMGDIARGLGSLLQGGFDFMTKGGITNALVQGAKDLFTDPTGTAKNMYYGAQDMMKGYNPLTKSTVAPTPEIKAEPLPGLDLGAKMSAYTDPIQHYNNIHKVGYVDEPKFIPRTGDTPGKYTDSFLDKMDENRDYYRMNEMPAELLMPKQELNRGVMTPEEFRLQKLIQPYERLEASNTLQDPYALLRGQNNQTMIFNRGGRVRGTGIMGAL